MILPLLPYGGIVGLSLGLTGGGSIFAVPLLVYGLETDLPVALSLAAGELDLFIRRASSG